MSFYEVINSIRWNDKCLPLSDFVQKFPLPQIVKVDKGFHGGSDENSLSSGQILKIHKLTVEKKTLCYDRNKKEVYIPINSDQKVELRPENYDVIYQTVADLARAKPIPSYVEVTRGYYVVDSNVNNELSVEPGDKLEVVNDLHIKRKKYMLFKMVDGAEIKIPFDCFAGFRPLIDSNQYLLSMILPAFNNDRKFPFYFEFVGSHNRFGVLKCMSVFDDKLIIASCGEEDFQMVFTIPQNLAITVKPAMGTLEEDPTYDAIRSSYHDFAKIESQVCHARRSHVYWSSEISGYTVNSSLYSDKEEVSISLHPVRSGEIFLTDCSADSSLSEEVSKKNGKKPLLDFDNLCIVNTDACIEAEKIKIKKASNSNDSPIEEMSMQELCECLHWLNMSKHVAAFEENLVDGFLLSKLNKEELMDLGLNTFEITKLLSFKNGWRPKI